MDYSIIYDKLILKAKTEERSKGSGIYYERHHIIPKCIGGTDNKSNLVLLTAKEHYVAHKLLCEIYPLDNSLRTALWLFCNGYDNKSRRAYKVSSYEYDRIKQEISLIASERSKARKGKYSLETRNKISQSNKGKVFTEEHKKNLSEACIGRKPWNTGKRHSEETKRKIAASQLGVPLGPMKADHKKKIGDALRGKPKPRSICPHCGLEASINRLNAFHNDKCKLKKS